MRVIHRQPEFPPNLKTTVEFDGFMKFELALSADDNVKVKQLYLDCPLRPDQMKYYISPFRGYSPMLIMDTWGTLTKKRKFKFYNTCFTHGHGCFMELVL